MLILVADAHETADSTTRDDFLAMLDAISNTTHDVAFLGDIMDLWIAIPRYEDNLQRAFLKWCTTESKRRKVFFVEGNHEFFVAKNHQHAFSITNKAQITIPNLCRLEHGHNIQEGPLGFNRLFMHLCKSTLGYVILKLMPFGQKVAETVKKRLGSNGKIFPTKLPTQRITHWTNSLNNAPQYVFIGHFHIAENITTQNGRTCHIIPPWKNNQEITLFDYNTHSITTTPWKNALLPPPLTRPPVPRP